MTEKTSKQERYKNASRQVEQSRERLRYNRQALKHLEAESRALSALHRNTGQQLMEMAKKMPSGELGHLIRKTWEQTAETERQCRHALEEQYLRLKSEQKQLRMAEEAALYRQKTAGQPQEKEKS